LRKGGEGISAKLRERAEGKPGSNHPSPLPVKLEQTLEEPRYGPVPNTHLLPLASKIVSLGMVRVLPRREGEGGVLEGMRRQQAPSLGIPQSTGVGGTVGSLRGPRLAGALPPLPFFPLSPRSFSADH